MTVSPISEAFPALTGRQQPHHLSVFAGDTTHGAKAIELKRRIGVESMPWQVDSQHALCSTTPEGKWTHPTCCILCTRQNGKSEILIDRCLYGLFKLDETIVYTAQRWKTARDAWRRMVALINRRPWLRKHVVRKTCSQGEGVIELDSGALIMFCPRSPDFKGPTKINLIVYDEAYDLTVGEVVAFSFTQMAVDNPQRIYASTAVNQEQHTNGDVLAGIRRRGLAGEDRLYFAEWMAPDDPSCCEACAAAGEMSRDDEATWQYANPSYGVIQTAEKIGDIKADLDTEVGRKGFDVDALGRGDWPKWEEELSKVIDPDVWTSRIDRDVELTGWRVIGLALAPDRKTWAVSAAQRTVDGRVFGEIGLWRPTPHDEVLRFVSAVIADWDPAAIVMDSRSLSMVLASKLEAIGVEPVRFNTPNMAQACGTLLDDIDSGAFCHGGQPELELAARAVQKRELPQGDFVLDCGQESAPMVAVALAHQGVLRFASKPVARPASPSQGVPVGRAAKSEELDLLSVAF